VSQIGKQEVSPKQKSRGKYQGTVGYREITGKDPSRVSTRHEGKRESVQKGESFSIQNPSIQARGTKDEPKKNAGEQRESRREIELSRKKKKERGLYGVRNVFVDKSKAHDPESAHFKRIKALRHFLGRLGKGGMLLRKKKCQTLFDQKRQSTHVSNEGRYFELGEKDSNRLQEKRKKPKKNAINRWTG